MSRRAGTVIALQKARERIGHLLAADQEPEGRPSEAWVEWELRTRRRHYQRIEAYLIETLLATRLEWPTPEGMIAEFFQEIEIER